MILTVIRSWNNETTLTVVFMLKINELLADQRSVLWVTRVTSGLKMRNPTKLAGSRWRDYMNLGSETTTRGNTMVLVYNGSEAESREKLPQMYTEPRAAHQHGSDRAEASGKPREFSGSSWEASDLPLNLCTALNY